MNSEKETRTSENEAEILKQKSELILILNSKFMTHTVFTCGPNHLPDLLAMNSSLKKQATDQFFFLFFFYDIYYTVNIMTWFFSNAKHPLNRD